MGVCARFRQTLATHCDAVSDSPVRPRANGGSFAALVDFEFTDGTMFLGVQTFFLQDNDIFNGMPAGVVGVGLGAADHNSGFAVFLAVAYTDPNSPTPIGTFNPSGGGDLSGGISSFTNTDSDTLVFSPSNITAITVTAKSTVPEPGTLLLGVVGLSLLCAGRRRKQVHQSTRRAALRIKKTRA
jgi:hypothetical protein